VTCLTETSAVVTRYVAVHRMDSLAASVVRGQRIAERPGRLSRTWTWLRVILPVLETRNVNVMTWPGALNMRGLAVLTTLIAGFWTALMVASEAARSPG
jgi:hypothetical protein